MQLSDYALPLATYFAEFLGTFFVVFTASLLALRDVDLVGSWAWRASGVAFATVASISATSAVTGSHLNPAVSLAFGLARKMYWGRVWKYILVQVAAGVSACFSVRVLMQQEVPKVEPQPYYSFLDACLVEGVYSAMYCLVALNCMVSLQNNPRGFRNQFFPLAVGFCVVAGGPPCSAVSGGFLNPAITLGFCLAHLGDHVARALLLAAAQVLGAVAAAVIFFLVRPEELSALGIGVGEGLSCRRLCNAVGALNFCGRRKEELVEDSEEEEELAADPAQRYRPPWAARILSELLGTYFVVLTFGLCAMATNRSMKTATTTGAPSARLVLSTPYSTGATVLSLSYALGSVSAHFNPAVTLAVMLGSRDPYVWAEAPTRILVQGVGGVAAALTYLFVSRGQQAVAQDLPHLGPGADYSWIAVNISEMLFTLAVAYVVLCMTTVNSPRYPKASSTTSFDFGFAIGFTYMAAGWVTQWVSGGMLNPAISFGVATADLLQHGRAGLDSGKIGQMASSLLQYVGWQCAGGALASLLFWLVHPLLYKKDPLLAK